MYVLSRVLQKTVGVLFDPELGSSMFASGHTSRRVASWRTNAVILRLELASAPTVLVFATNSTMMSGGQGWRRMMLDLDLEVSSHTTPATNLEAFQNPRWMGSRWIISERWMGRSAIRATKSLQSPIYRWKSDYIQSLSPPPCGKAL